VLRGFIASTALRLFYLAPCVGVFCVWQLRLLEFVFCGIAKPTLGNTSGFPGRLIDAVLHKYRELDTDSLCVFNNLSMAKDGIHLCSGSLFGIFTE
jgi:hypothetical protein